MPDSIKFTASSAASGGTIEVWLDSLETGEKIAECPIRNTGDLKTFQTFTSAVKPVSGRHDVYLKFVGAETGKLFQLQWLVFTVQGGTHSPAPRFSDSAMPRRSGLEQNFPNPFNPSTRIRFEVPDPSFVSLKVYNLLGEEISELAGKDFFAGAHSVTFDASRLAGGPYVYTLRAKDFVQSKKMLILK
jgi:xylan 1,4-beta-xylosidase